MSATIEQATDRVELVCWKIWGGNSRASLPVRLPGLKGVLYAMPSGSERGGDLYYLSACGSGAVARLCLADAVGHGEGVAQFSAWLQRVFGAHIHRENPAAVLDEVNKRAVTGHLDLIATALCLSYNSLNGGLRFASAGHPHARVLRQDGGAWEPLELERPGGEALWNIPLGVESAARYVYNERRLHPGDWLIAHTDGLTESRSPSGELLGNRLWELCATRNPGETPDDCAARILDTLRVHLGRDISAQDDVTFVLLEVLPWQRSGRYTLLVRNNWHRALRWLRSGD